MPPAKASAGGPEGERSAGVLPGDARTRGQRHRSRRGGGGGAETFAAMIAWRRGCCASDVTVTSSRPADAAHPAGACPGDDSTIENAAGSGAARPASAARHTRVDAVDALHRGSVICSGSGTSKCAQFGVPLGFKRDAQLITQNTTCPPRQQAGLTGITALAATKRRQAEPPAPPALRPRATSATSPSSGMHILADQPLGLAFQRDALAGFRRGWHAHRRRQHHFAFVTEVDDRPVAGRFGGQSKSPHTITGRNLPRNLGRIAGVARIFQ